jgi:hypothetical protein
VEAKMSEADQKQHESDTPADGPERRRPGPIAEQTTDREPPPNEVPSWTGDPDQGTTDEPAKD